MTLILDAGAFLALERNDRAMWARLEVARRGGLRSLTHGGVVAQVWRGGGGRQALLARALQVVETASVDESLGRRAGVLLARTGMTDAVDAAVAALSRDGDVIVTSDPDDLATLVEAARSRADVVQA